MNKTVKNYVSSCHECQVNKGKPIHVGKMKPITVTKFEPFGHLELDFIGPLSVPFTKNYVLVCVDKNSNFCVIKPTASPNSETVISLLKEIKRNFNSPNKISCDNGSHFNNDLVKKFCENENISLIFSSAYSPQSQGLVERINGVLKNCLKNYSPTNNENWLDTLFNIVATYNSTPIAHLDNKSPFYLVHGYNEKSVLERKLNIYDEPNFSSRSEEIENSDKTRSEIPDLINKHGQKNKFYYDKNKSSNIFKPNDLVLIRPGKNLSNIKLKFDGPFRVLEQLGELTYLVKVKDNIEQIHVRRIIPYTERDGNANIPPKLNIQDELKKLGRFTCNNAHITVDNIHSTNSDCSFQSNLADINNKVTIEDDPESLLLHGMTQPFVKPNFT